MVAMPLSVYRSTRVMYPGLLRVHLREWDPVPLTLLSILPPTPMWPFSGVHNESFSTVPVPMSQAYDLLSSLASVTVLPILICFDTLRAAYSVAGSGRFSSIVAMFSRK